MGFGNQSRALIIASKLAGWDPTQLKGGGSILPFDHDPGTNADERKYVGPLPEGTPDSFPKAAEPGVLSEQMTFNAPDAGKENANRRTNGANPYPGFGGQ